MFEKEQQSHSQPGPCWHFCGPSLFLKPWETLLINHCTLSNQTSDSSKQCPGRHYQSIRVGIEVETIFHLWSRESPKTTIMFINNPCTSFGLPCQRRTHYLPLSPELELNPLFSVSLIKHQMKSLACDKESCYMEKCLHFFLLRRFITLCSAHTGRGTQELRPTENILE